VAIINGRRVTNVPSSGVYGRDIIKETGGETGRRVVIQREGLGFETVQSARRYSKADLIDKKGNAVRVKSIPDRTKGTFGGARSAVSKQVIKEQVFDIAEHLFKDGIDFDDENADWMVVPKYYLPQIWHGIARTVPLLIVFPTEYPSRPPVGFYLKADIPCSPNGHLYDAAYHEADHTPLQRGWRWYCVYVNSGQWRPAPVQRSGDWRRGDNLWEYFTLVNEALASRGD
jgi:hypothetical protein